MTVIDRSVLITGASRGLGAALAAELAGRGARVVLAARGEAALERSVARIRADGGVAHGLTFDVGEARAAYHLAGAAAALAGPIDILIHNASTLGEIPLPLLLDTTSESFERVLDVNLLAPFRITKAVAGSMVLRRSGLIVQVTSDASVNAYPGWGAYGASKAALDHLGRIWAAELEGSGVRFVTVDPGEMNTAMHSDAIPGADPATLCDPSEVARRLVTLIEIAERIPSGTRIAAAEFPPAPPVLLEAAGARGAPERFSTLSSSNTRGAAS